MYPTLSTFFARLILSKALLLPKGILHVPKFLCSPVCTQIHSRANTSDIVEDTDKSLMEVPTAIARMGGEL